MYQAVLSVFYDLFMSMESDGILDPDSDNYLFCLHAVYHPIINKMLERFSNSWVHHKIRTAENKSPLQLFIMGMQQIGREGGMVTTEYFEVLSEVRRAQAQLDGLFILIS